MEPTVLVENYPEKYPRCKSCGKPLWKYGTDHSDYCVRCYGVEVLGKPEGDLGDVLCMCGRLAIVDYPMSFITGSGAEYTYLEPLCYVCWMIEDYYEQA